MEGLLSFVSWWFSGECGNVMELCVIEEIMGNISGDPSIVRVVAVHA